MNYEYAVIICTDGAIDITNIEIEAGQQYNCENSLASVCAHMSKRGWGLHTVLFDPDVDDVDLHRIISVWERPVDDITKWQAEHT